MNEVKLLEKVKADDDYIFEFYAESFYRPLYYLAPENYFSKKPSDDVGNCIEYTLHRLLDEGCSDEEVYAVLGAEKSSECEENDLYIDLGYVIKGQILDAKKI